MTKVSDYLESKDFSIVLGGPFFQLLNKAHLTGKALELVKLRIIVISITCWLPPFVFSILTGQGWGGNSNLPFIEDLEVHIRFLMALPLMIIAELVVHQRMLSVVNQFEERSLIPDDAKEQFHDAIAAALRLRNSVFAEVLIVVLVYIIGYSLVWHPSMAIDATSWYSEPALGEGKLSLAGTWFRYVSLPLFQFLFLRWYYRVFIWARFLFQASRIKLKLVATHPDRVGGLGFLANSVYAFMPLALVHGAVVTGTISNHIFHEGAVLLDFKIEILIVILVVACLIILPLFFFSSQLANAKRSGSLAYGKFASHYVQGFENRWIRVSTLAENPLSSATEIQGLADLIDSYKSVERMLPVPITRNVLLTLVVVTLAPLLPLLLTMMPIGELVKMAVGVLF